MTSPIAIGGAGLSTADVTAIARGAPVALTDAVRARMARGAERYDEIHPGSILQAKWSWLTSRPSPDTETLVAAFVVGHCAGVGEPLPADLVRAMMATRLNVLASGLTGCRPECADLLAAMLNRGVVPVVPSQGSVGAAGDLAPLAHVVRVATRLGGTAWRDGQRLPAAEAMEGLPVVELREKEALSLINGASLTAGAAAIAVERARMLFRTALTACAMSFEVCRADLGCLSAGAIGARNHPGAITVAAELRRLLDDSELVAVGRRPDPFSLRCAPAVLGAALDAIDHVQQVVERELNGACDNPLVLPDEGLVEAGNFHGAPVSLVMDHLATALVQVASIAERRVFRMTYGQLSGLPSFLVPATGLNSGLMLAQYTAASLVSEAKVRAHAASVDTIPTVQHHEDHVSMGPIAARRALHTADLLADVIAIELLCAAQGMDLHLAADLPAAPQAGAGTATALRRVRELVPQWTRDRVLHPDLARIGAAVRAGRFADPQ